MNIKIARRIAAATVVGAALIGAAPASADWFSSTTGVSAVSGGTRGQVAVTDTAADNNPVYAHYYRYHGVGEEFLWNNSGAGKTAYSDFNEAHRITWLQGCVFHNSGSDSCGPVVSER